MTVVAAMIPHGMPMLIGDLLVTAETDKAVPGIPLPTMANSEEIFPIEAGYKFRLVQKLSLISDSIALGWAGRAVEAKSAIRELRQLASQGRFDGNDLMAWIKKTADANTYRELSLVALCVDPDRTVRLSCYNATRGRIESLDSDCLAAGSGAATFLHVARGVHLAEVNGPPSFKALGYANSIFSELLTREINARGADTRNPLYEFFGASYEMVVLGENGKLSKLPSPSYIFWNIRATEEQVAVAPAYRFVRHQYDGDCLFIRSCTAPPHPGTVRIPWSEQKCEIVHTVDWSSSTPPAQKLPTFTSSLECHCALVTEGNLQYVAVHPWMPTTEEGRYVRFTENDIDQSTTVTINMEIAKRIAHGIHRYGKQFNASRGGYGTSH